MNIENILSSMPESWEAIDLGKVLSELTDYTANGSFASLKENVVYYSEPEYAVLVRTTDLKKKVFKPQRFTDKKGYDFLDKSTLFGGEILMANVGSIGEVYLVPEYEQPMTLAPNMYLIKYKPTELDNAYAFHFMNSNIFLKQLFSKIASTTLKAINKNNFRAIKIPLPPLKEQEKIADILSTADDKIDAITSQIEKAQTLKKGLLQKLLSEGIGHSEFKDSELGKIPLSWEVERIGNICNCIVPGRNKPVVFDGDIPWITTPDLDSKYISKTKNNLYISEDEANKIGSKIVPINSIIMSCVGNLGILAITKKKIIINQQLHAFLPSELVNMEFLHYALFTQQKYMNKIATKTAVPYMNKDNCNSIPIPLPPLEEQKQIADILSTADEKLEVLRAKKEKYETLKKGLFQKLLSGEVRV